MALLVISPATTARPVVTRVSQATRLKGSWANSASSTPSEIWSASLSGWPPLTDSLVNRYLPDATCRSPEIAESLVSPPRPAGRWLVRHYNQGGIAGSTDNGEQRRWVVVEVAGGIPARRLGLGRRGSRGRQAL